MPLYEYKCAVCHDVFEVIQKFSDEPLHEHPGCGGAVERLVSAPTLQFKGSGWYVTDYGRNGSSSVKDKEKAKGESGGGNGKKDQAAKPAASPAKEPSTSAKSE